MTKTQTEAVGTFDEMSLPTCRESETYVLGGLVLEPSLIDEVRLIVNPGDFFFTGNRHIYGAILALHDRGVIPELTTLRDELKSNGNLEAAGGILGLAQILDEVVTTANIMHHAHTIHDTVLRRIAMTGAYGIAQAVQNGGSIQEIERDLARLTDAITDQNAARPYVRISDIAPECARQIEDIARGIETQAAGLQTGFYDFDDITGGFMPQDLVIIAARPSMGKTSIATNIACTIGKRLPVLIFSIETSAEQIVQRMVLQQSKVSSQRIKNHTLTQMNWESIVGAFAELSDLDIYIDDSADQTPQTLTAKARILRREKGRVGIIIVDYLQLMRAGQRTENRNMEITVISRGLKMLAKEMNCPVVALSQLSRDVEKRTNKRPQLSDLRDSGAIEQDADLVVFIYRDEVYHPDCEAAGIAEINIGKQRNGPTGTVKLAFLKDCMCFSSLAREERPA